MVIVQPLPDTETDVKANVDPDITMGPMTPASNPSPRQKVKVEAEYVPNGHDKDDPSHSKIKIKQEEQEDVKDLPAAQDDDPFGDDEYVDDEYEGIAEDDDGTEYFVCKEMKIQRVPKANIFMRSLGDLYNISKTKYMNLEPEYQREVVWDEHRASELIKSIFIGYFIPPLIFNLITKSEPDGKGGKQIKYYRVCVDGKQRMTSVMKFMDGHIGFSDASHPSKKWYYRHPTVNGVEKVTNHNIMPEAMKKMFRDAEFCCYEYVNLSLHTEETMFQLVQRGIALTPAERMKAMSTEWAQFTKKYEEDYSIVVNLSKQNRASGFRTVLTIFTMIQEVMARVEQGKSGIPTLQSSPQALNKVLNDKDPISESLKFEFKEVFDKFESLVKASSTQLESGTWVINRNTPFDPAPDFLKEETVNHVKTYSPLELLATGVLLAKHMGDRSDELLLGDIKEMRHYLREKHKDLRVNAQCWVSTWDFLDFELLRRRGGPGGTPMPNARRHSDTLVGDIEEAVSSEASGKRTRDDIEETNDEQEPAQASLASKRSRR